MAKFNFSFIFILLTNKFNTMNKLVVLFAFFNIKYFFTGSTKAGNVAAGSKSH